MEEEKKKIIHKTTLPIRSFEHCKVCRVIEIDSNGNIISEGFQVFSYDMTPLGGLLSLSAAVAWAQEYDKEQEPDNDGDTPSPQHPFDR